MRLRLLLCALLLLVGVNAQAQATRVISGATLPSCTTGSVYVKTGSGAGWYICQGASWTGPYPTAAGSGTVTSIATTSPITGGTITGTGTIACATCGVTGSPLSQFASTTSAQLAGVLSNETGTGLAVFATSPTLTTPILGTPTSATLTNATGLPEAGLTLADNTTNDSSTSKHGLVPKLPGGTTTFYRADGSFASPSISAGGALSLIGESLLGSDTATISFTSIPGTFRHLKLLCYGRTTEAVTDDLIYLRFNNDSGANYDFENVYVVNATGTNSASRAQTFIRFGDWPGTTSTTTTEASMSEATIFHYAGTTFDKNVFTNFGGVWGTSGNTIMGGLFAGFWRSTAAISQVDVFVAGGGNLKAGTLCSLYGMS